MKHVAGRKRHSAEDIVRKLRRADELAAQGKYGEEIAADLQVSPATLYTWRRTYGGWTRTPPRNSRSCANRTAASSGCWQRQSWRKTRCGRSRRENSEPSRQAPRRGHAQRHAGHVGTVGVQGGWAGPFHLPAPTSGAVSCRSGADLRAWLRRYATKHPCHGFRRAWAALRHAERREVNKRRCIVCGARRDC
jgi:transposase-like protein